MIYNFDEKIERIHTNSVKYENSRAEEPDLPEDFIPLWIADMDFACPPEVISAMHKRLDCRILGYSDIIDPEYVRVLKHWMEHRFGWSVREEELAVSSGVVPAISNLIQILSEKGDRVLIMTPSYAPFYSSVVNNGRIPVCLPLKEEGGYYEIDYTGMEKKIAEEAVKIFIFCSPHNPTGRVWKEEELRNIAEICRKYGVPIICDEIHQDLLRKGKVHIPLAKLYPDADWIYTCTAPSKTFNMAGNHLANIFIPNKKVKEIWDDKYYYLPNALSVTATQTAYGQGEAWVEQLNEYLDGNFFYMKEFFDKYLPQIEFEIPEGTYLAWFDMGGFGLDRKEIKRRFIVEAGLYIEDGDMFVANGGCNIRMNLACPRRTVERALNRMYQTFGSH